MMMENAYRIDLEKYALQKILYCREKAWIGYLIAEGEIKYDHENEIIIWQANGKTFYSKLPREKLDPRSVLDGNRLYCYFEGYELKFVLKREVNG